MLDYGVLDLFGYQTGVTAFDKLPIKDTDKKLLASVQRVDRTLYKWLREHKNNDEWFPIEDYPFPSEKAKQAMKGCEVNLKRGQVKKSNGTLVHWSGTGDNNNYLADGMGNYLPRIVAFTYARVAMPELYYSEIKDNPHGWEVHHVDPKTRTTGLGNSIRNLRLLPKGLHHKVTQLTRQLRHVQEDERNIDIKPIFYHE